MFWLCPQKLCLEMRRLSLCLLWWWTHFKSSNPRIDKVLTQLCSSCRLGRGGGTCLALKSSQGAEKRRWSGGESVTGQLSNTRHHKIKWRLWYSFQSRQKLKLFKLLRISIFQVEGQIVVECRKYLPQIGRRSSFKYLKSKVQKTLYAKINQTKEGWHHSVDSLIQSWSSWKCHMNQKQFAFVNAMFEFLHFSIILKPSCLSYFIFISIFQ